MQPSTITARLIVSGATTPMMDTFARASMRCGMEKGRQKPKAMTATITARSRNWSPLHSVPNVDVAYLFAGRHARAGMHACMDTNIHTQTHAHTRREPTEYTHTLSTHVCYGPAHMHARA